MFFPSASPEGPKATCTARWLSVEYWACKPIVTEVPGVRSNFQFRPM